jgi:hypothetical protein
MNAGELMARNAFRSLLFLTMTFGFASTAFSASFTFSPTTTGTYDANNPANWANGTGVPSNNGTDVNFLEAITSGNLVLATNFLFSSSGVQSINYLRFNTSGGSLTAITAANGFQSQYGFEIDNANDTFIVDANSTLSFNGTGDYLNNQGTLIVSNGATLVQNSTWTGGGNQGTITIVSGSSQTGTLNFYGNGQFVNSGTGTLIVMGAGTGVFEGLSGGNSQNFQNYGTMVVMGGEMIVDPNGATGNNGFQNESSGTMVISNGGTLVLNRTSGAWGNADALNQGTLVLSNGTFAAFQNSTTAFTNGSQGGGSWQNQGTITGWGTISAPFYPNQGTVTANNGTLTFVGTVYDPNTAGGATFSATNHNTLQFLGQNTATLANGTLFNTNGTVQVGSGDWLILPNSFNNNAGTLSISGGSSLSYGNQSGNSTFVNAGTGVIVGGGASGFFVQSIGQSSYSFINNGTILANSGSFYIDTGNSANAYGFSNSASGTIIISNGATFGIVKEAADWPPDVPLLGNTILSNGTLKIFTDTSFLLSGYTENTGASNGSIDVDGKLSGWGTVTAPVFMPTSGSNVAMNGTLTFGRVYTSPGNGDTWIATNIMSGSSIAVTNVLSFNGGNAGIADLSHSILINTNGSVEVTAGTLYLPTNYFRNDGTLLFTGGTGFMSYSNQTGLHEFTNSAVGVIMGSGTLQTGYGLGQNNYGIINKGMILATNGTLVLNPNDALTFGGFINDLGATVQVDSASTFELNRSANEWLNVPGTVPTNNGTILLNGGTFALASAGIISNAANMVNTNTIVGFGTLAASIRQTSTGQIIASNGVLNIFAGSSVVTAAVAGAQMGTFSAVNGGTMKILGSVTGTSATSATWVVNSGGTIQVASGGGATFNSQAGTFSMQGGTFQLTNLAAVGVAGAFTNSASGIIMGSGTVQTGYGNGNGNWGLINQGSIYATNSNALLTFDPENAYYNAFSNAAGASVVVSNGATLAIQRTAAAWGLQGVGSPSDTNVVNAGNIVLNNGTFAMQISGSAIGVGATNQFRNIGTISGQGLVLGTVNNVSSGSIIASNGGSLIVAGGDASMGFTNTGTLEANASSTLLLSNTVAATALTFANQGTIIANGGTIIAGTITNQNLITGTGTIAGGALINTGTILATNGASGTLTFNPGVTFTAWSNALSGTVVISNGTTVVIQRTAAAAAAGDTNVVNSGKLIMNNGTLVGNVGTGNVGTYTLRNSGTIQVVANSSNSIGFALINAGTTAITNASALNASGSFVFNSGLITNNAGLLTMAGALTNQGQLVILNGGAVTNGNAIISGASTSLVSGAGSVWSNLLLMVGNGTANGSVTVSNNAKLISATGTIGNGGSSNAVTVTGNNSSWNLASQDLTVGTGTATGNVLNVAGGSTMNLTNLILSATSAAVGDRVNISGGNLAVTNAAGTGRIVVGQLGQGTFTLNSGVVSVNQLFVTNNTAGATVNTNVFVFNSGQLNTAGTTVSNGLPFFIGNGTGAATNNLLGGTHSFDTSLTISSNSMLELLVSNPTTITTPVMVNQAGGLFVVDGGSLTINGVVTNFGNVNFINANVTFNGDYFDYGTTLSDDPISVFGADLIVGGPIARVLIDSEGDIIASNLIITAGGDYQLLTDSFSRVSGTVSNSGALEVSDGTISALKGMILGPSLGSTGTVLVTGGVSALFVTNAAHTSSLVVGQNGRGVYTQDGGSLTVDRLIITNGANSVFTFNGGTIDTRYTQVANGSAFTVGDGTDAAQLNLDGGTHSFANGMIVNENGTLHSVNAMATFNGVVVNSGAWITDPSTNVFNNTYTVTSSGYINAAAGDVYDFHSNFVNQSTQNTSYSTFNTTPGGSGANGTKFIFDNASGPGTVLTQQYFTAGLKLTGGFVGIPNPLSNGVQFVSSFPAVTGFTNNFALDRLEIGNLGTNSLMELSASADIGGASDDTNALFVNDLWLFGSSDLIISNNTVLYFVNSNNWTMANVTLLGNGELHQLELQIPATVPEPSVVLLWLCGFATVYGSRRRAKRLADRS